MIIHGIYIDYEIYIELSINSTQFLYNCLLSSIQTWQEKKQLCFNSAIIIIICISCLGARQWQLAGTVNVLKTLQVKYKLFKKQDRSVNQYRWIVNLSSTTIIDQQKSVLSKGLNFAPTLKRVPVETALKSSKADPNSVSQARSRVIGVLNKPPRLTPNLHPLESQVLKELKNNEDILILPADKGRATVILDREKYNTKLLTTLKDVSVYEQLKKDPSADLERKMNSTLLQLNRCDKIQDFLYNHLRSSGGANTKDLWTTKNP